MSHGPHPPRTWAVALVALAMLAARSLAQAEPVPAGAHPWWDDFPFIIQCSSVDEAARYRPTASMCGDADDAAWGIYGQRVRVAEARGRALRFQAAGIRPLAWVEGFGNPSCYVIQIKQNPDGSWIKVPGTDVTRVFCNAWGWKVFDGTGEAHWVGVHTYFDDVDYARPYTRTHPRYGTPPMCYPDGRVATGYDGPARDPRNSRVFDAGCGKDVLGHMWGDARGKPLITDVLRGSVAESADRAAMADPATIMPDPGFTPAEWAERTRQSGALLRVEADKDSACPLWIDYARAEVRLALDTGLAGLWVDNFSAWDSFNASPLHHAFGEWSVARFRDHLRTNFAPGTLRDLGIMDLPTFDVRQYLQARVREWGGDPEDLKGAAWRDPRWKDDRIWRAYLIHKRRVGAEALSRVYRVLKEEAASAGKPDFLVMGNDIPTFSLGWVRGDLDMVSTELTWGWWLTLGPRGIMPPPLGCYVPIFKLAREHARSRFVNAWTYVPEPYASRPNIARLLYYQELATHALPMPQPGNARVAGTPETDTAYGDFLRRAAPVFGDRAPVEEVGLYYSSSSQLVEMLPAWFRDFDNQRHSFSFYGWGAALTQLHVPWRAVPEWKLTPSALESLRLLVIPSAEVFPAEDLAVLEQWVGAGGALIIAGDCGTRLGEAGNLDPCSTGSTLASLREVGGEPQPRLLGAGKALALREDPGFAFYKAAEARPSLLAEFARTLARIHPPEANSLWAPDVSWKVGLTLYRDRSRIFVDVNNTDLDLEKDVIEPTLPLRFTVALPPELRGKELRTAVLSPDAVPQSELKPLADGRLEVTLGPVLVYASVLIEPAQSP